MVDNIRALSRGKRIDTREWMIGYLVTINPLRLSSELNTNSSGGDLVEINVETYGECTGVREKNKSLIFAGDIVKGKNDRLYLVYQSTMCLKFALQALNEKRRSPRMIVTIMRNFEVVGNKFDNPELMKGAYDDGQD